MSETSCTHIDLLRHGETTAGGSFCGHSNPPLTARGRRQMLAAVKGAGPWEAIVSSPLARCAEFARALARRQAIPFQSDERLREINFGAWEGRSAAELLARESEALAQFWTDPVTHPPPRAEPLTQFQARTLAAWEAVVEDHCQRRVLLVTHGGVIRVILCHLVGQPLSRMLRMEVAHASLHRVRICHHAAGAIAELLAAAAP